MPQATKELQDLIKEYFDDGLNSHLPAAYLAGEGYTLTQDWYWLPKPGVNIYADMTEKEFHCLVFLVQEWDFGGLVLRSTE